MMPIRGPGWDLVLFVCVLVGFGLLALASDREGRTVTGQSPSLRRKRLLRAVGWPVLVLALTIGVIGWRGNFGTVVWLGWLTVAALIVVFGIAVVFPAGGRPEGRRVRRALRSANSSGEAGGVGVADKAGVPRIADLPDSTSAAESGVRQVAALRCTAVATVVTPASVLIPGLLLLPIAFFVLLWRAPAHPLEGPDVVESVVGPWSFTLAEETSEGPEPTPAGECIKHLVLRFCDRCDAGIRAAYVQGRLPWSPLSKGLRFTDGPGLREGLLAIPASRKDIDAVWITVVTKDGRLHRTSLPLERVMPATVAGMVSESPCLGAAEAKKGAMRQAFSWIGLAVLLAGLGVRAHGPGEARVPALYCNAVGLTLACRGGWSTGAPLLLWTYHVVDDEGVTIQSGHLDSKGSFIIDRPARPFAIILVDGEGSGQSVEIRGARIPAAAAEAGAVATPCSAVDVGVDVEAVSGLCLPRERC